MATATRSERYQSTHTLDELAILLITTPDRIEQPKDGGTVIITTKEAYYWAVLFSELVSSDRDDPNWFIERFRTVLADRRDLLRLQYATLGPDPKNENPAYVFFREVVSACGNDPEELFQRADDAYQGLLGKELIEDPFKKRIASFLLAAVGLIPTGFSSTTEKGGAYVREIHAVTWSYIDTLDPHQKETKKIEFRLREFIDILQPRMLEAHDEMVMDNGGGKGEQK